MSDESSETNRLLWQDAQGDPEQFGALLEQSRPRLRRMVALRLDPRLHGRIDPSDVIQETYLEASTRLAEYVQKPTMPLRLRMVFCQSFSRRTKTSSSNAFQPSSTMISDGVPSSRCSMRWNR